MSMTERSGEIVLLRELYVDENVVGKYVRVTGEIIYIDTVLNYCQIRHDDSVLIVDLNIVTLNERTRLHSWVQFIGQVRAWSDISNRFAAASTKEKFFLYAKISRLVDGLDIKLYEEAILVRRVFVAKLRNQQNSSSAIAGGGGKENTNTNDVGDTDMQTQEDD